MIHWLMIALGVVLTAGTAVFVAGEFSLVALDPSTVETRAVQGDRRAVTVRKALGRLSTLLSGAQVGITLTTILLGYTMQDALATLLEEVMTGWVAQSVAAGVAAVTALVFVNAFSMVLGELIPKNATLSDPLRAAGMVAPALMAFTTLLKPVIIVLNDTANLVLHRLGIEPAEEISGTRSAGELAALVRHSAEEGTLDLSTATLLTRSIGVGRLTAVDVMTDRGRLHTLEADATADAVVELARATGHSRFPVIGEDVDDVLGVVHLRRAIAVPFERRSSVSVVSSSLMTPAPRVPETMPLASLLVELRATGSQMALVVDEYGGTAGVVTLEDAVEEIVGDVADEHDRRRGGVHMDADGNWIVPGWMRPDELAARADIHVPDDGPYETLGGLVMAELGRIPQIGDVVTTARAQLTVEAMEGRRVTRLRARGLDLGEDAVKEER
ncbi:hemolysin family protein [Actinomyces urogenitalis]|uniref:hemolysin family protein n=1 Tax=Actinomyces urogenitalis TaxID=103621 RepID=UPI002904B0AD|nr:hemolysin family protein [Actinomyces urogenitalis]MDU0864402.1 hemolysin family protein [Actinomyces urogenitalis]MDU0874823.1 hemolysin family protein [Actinomyces urogenitalis]MDU1564785.1 hemolysin family protein [Actinomyces urogenitalis]MDU1640005.1 hemolysin family protein [Actinomyces urogenitalis]MDU6151917.1 hemolysin family protein [Actinomyces urogenitalis]